MNPDSPNLFLTAEERALLKKYLRFYLALAKGLRSPATAAQKHFVDATLGRVPAETPHERAYLKHVRLQKQNQTSGPIRDPEIDGPTDGWFTRDDWRKSRGRQRWDGHTS